MSAGANVPLLLLHLLGSPQAALSPQFSGRDQPRQEEEEEEEEPEHDQVVSVMVLVVVEVTRVFSTRLVSVSNIGMRQFL